jgi:uncharacterized membrane protein YgdD (TMEM256/DUF423 family)
MQDLDNSGRWWLLCGAVLGGVGVGLGAFGAHGLETMLRQSGLGPDEQARLLNTWDVATKYQMYHALAVLITGLLATRTPHRAWTCAGGLFLCGVVIFSGCLYALVLSGVKLLGAIVPLGGVMLIAGWIALAVGVGLANRRV